MPRSDQQFSLLPPIIPYNKRTNARTTKTNVRAKKRTRARTTEPLRFSSASASCFKFNEFTEAFCTCFLFVNGDYDLNFTELTFSFHFHDTTCIWLYVNSHHGIRYGDQNLDTMNNEPDREGRQSFLKWAHHSITKDYLKVVSIECRYIKMKLIIAANLNEVPYWK